MRHRGLPGLAIIGWLALGIQPSLAAQAPSVSAVRQARAYERLGNGLLILRSAWTLPGITAPRFEQDANFFYFTGSADVLGAVLVLDGASRRAELFLPRGLPGILGFVAVDQPHPAAEAVRLPVDRVAEWGEFERYIDGRLAGDPRLSILVDGGGDGSRFYGGLASPLDSTAALANPWRLWRDAIVRRWPDARVTLDTVAPDVRAIKDSSEIAVLRKVGAASAAALVAGLRAFKPGARQRIVEGAVVDACLRQGGSGPSFWPWAMSGPNSAFPKPFTSLASPTHLDRVMQAGEVARLDIGCEIDRYMGDVGRTVPVSGMFDPGQREVVDLLVAAYRAGLATLRDGVTVEEVIAASIGEAARLTSTMKTELGRRAAAIITQRDRIPFWQIHGIGLEGAEDLPARLREGMVLAYEPIFAVGEQGFYMEDMILITRTGYEILSTGLPTTASEIERAMR
jgi:Xaa-Pro aminopeptidase